VKWDAGSDTPSMTFLIRRNSRNLLLLLVAVILPLVLTSCGTKLSYEEQMAVFEELPPWQIATGLAFFTLISEDVATIMAGLVASEGIIPFWVAVFGAFCGIYIEDVLIYFLGKIGGIGLLRHRPFRWLIKENQIHQAERLFEEHGGKMIFTSRFLPGSRIPLYVAAGVLNYPWWRFCLYMFIAAAVWTPILAWIAMKLGDVLIGWLKIYERYALPIFIVALLLIWMTIKIFEILATRRSRLIFLARVRSIYRKVFPVGPRGKSS